MNKIEGIGTDIIFGHYEGDDEHSWLEPDFINRVELTFTSDFIKIENYKKEFLNRISKAYDHLIKEYKRRLNND